VKETGIVRDKMIYFYSGDPLKIQHFVKVEAFASLIASKEKVDKQTAIVISILGYIHDIGIKFAEEQYGKCTGPLQEKLGEKPARDLLLSLGFEEETINRVSYVVSHHHTYSNIDNQEYQILVEADFLVNILEDGMKKDQILSIRDKIFKTKSGITLLNQMYKLK